MKKRNVALYDPYLDIMGGGEKHILSILQAVQDETHEIKVFWDKDLNKSIKNILNIRFEPEIKFVPNIFGLPFIKKLAALAPYDMLFYVTDGSYFFSPARKNFIFCMVPDKNLYSGGTVNKLKTLNAKFISNSKFTQNCLSRWGIKSEVIYPYIDQEYIDFDLNSVKKEKMILSVGRFFKHLHTKKHDVIINAFKKIKKETNLLKNFKLVLAGGLKDEDRDYFDEIKNMVKDDDSIILKTNISHNELQDLYRKSFVYWHFTGFGVDENKNPEMVEHLGITPLEAMANGCLTFCYNAGGPKEIITDSVTGFLFNNLEELKIKMTTAIENEKLAESIRTQAKKYVRENFSYSKFKNTVNKLIV